MTVCDGNIGNARFSFGKVRGACGFDSDYFVKISGPDDDNATLALTAEDTGTVVEDGDESLLEG
eukprot:CAMPEP_0194219010 /NCGR_PEP_ID=MMETSP0156-20130528/25019_1 /TAXON_ID=33649 /ORGANISM="Thalassionema nitzschioides, Strain L26-B" /LENGTH=63 /DNA_ID=CAMNT_0038948547 /DNA_START=423 /DNA_END=614 /DNA_ORIENTATION=+